MALEPLPPLYTSREELESVFSATAINQRIDDNFDALISGTEEGYLDEIILEATDLINQYLLPYYLPQDMETSRWIRRRASYLGCAILSRRRGNPKQFSEHQERITAELVAIAMGPGIPGNPVVPRIPLRRDFAPSYVNLEIDDRAWDPLRVHDHGRPAASTDYDESPHYIALTGRGP